MLRLLLREMGFINDLINQIHFIYYKLDPVKIALGINSFVVITKGIGISYKISKPRVKKLDIENIKTVKFWEDDMLILTNNGQLHTYGDRAHYCPDDNIKELHARNDYLLSRSFDDVIITMYYLTPCNSDLLKSYKHVCRGYEFNLNKYTKLYCTQYTLFAKALDNEVHSIAGNNGFEVPNLIKKSTISNGNHVILKGLTLYFNDIEIANNVLKFRFINDRIMTYNIDNTVSIYEKTELKKVIKL